MKAPNHIDLAHAYLAGGESPSTRRRVSPNSDTSTIALGAIAEHEMNLKLRSALREALDGWEGWIKSEYEGTRFFEPYMRRIAELQELVK